MNRASPQPTMKDVAREAGVSLGTVSKVINGIPVGEDYKKRVQAAIKALDYHVNAYAKGLKNNRTYTIAVIVPSIINPYFAHIVHYINQALVQRGYRMLLCSTGYNHDKEQEMVFMAGQNKLDGIIALTYNPNLKVSPDINFVSIDRHFDHGIPCVASDNYSGGRIAAETLAACGCRSLAFLRVGSSLISETNKRKDGFVAGCEALGLPYTLKILNDGAPYAEFEQFLQQNYQDGRLAFDGIFCVTDQLACMVTATLRQMGLQVPQQVQVIGFDGLRQFGEMGYYCSTIVQPVEAIAATCVDLVLAENRANAPSLVCLPVQYACGGTTKA